MKNLQININPDQILTIQIDLKQTVGESKTGRSEVICSSGGNLRLANSDGTFRDEIVNLSVTKRKPGTKPRIWFV